MSSTPSGGRWIYSSKRNPCPLCSRTKDRDCRRRGDVAVCHHTRDLKPGELVSRGSLAWAFTHNIDGRAAHFVLHKPRDGRQQQQRPPFRLVKGSRPPEAPLAPAPIDQAITLARLPEARPAGGSPYPYGAGRRVLRIDGEDGKEFRCQHLAGDAWVYGAGPDPWPVFNEPEAITAAAADSWILEFEGEKCTELATTAGYVAISQPGHAHKVDQIQGRYERLAAAGLAGIIYLADADDTGRKRAQQASEAAKLARLPLLVIHAGDLWPGLPVGGSIDDAPGPIADAMAAIEVAASAVAAQSSGDDGADDGADADDEGQGTPEDRPLTYSELISATLTSIKQEDEDGEMECRAELKQRFRLSDEQIETALFKRHSAENIKKADAEHNSLDMENIEQLGYLMDGWIPKGDVVLTYGSYGTGKTTLAMAKMHAHVTGKNLLDRDTPCTPGRGLFIATDSGAAPLKKTMADLGMDPDTNPLMKPGHPDQRIWVWAHQPSQGHGSWICNIHGVIRLERFIRENQITYVVIDSAKSVSSAAGWSYTSNESVKALLQYLREGIAQPTGCCLEFLSHDGTEKGSHSGAKAWAEDPSMVVSLEAAIDPESKKFTGIVAKFRKDRAAVVDARRELRYGLNDGQLERHPDVEVVSNCADALLAILWEAHLSGQDGLRGIDLKTEALVRFNRSSRTVENTLGKIAGSGRGPTPTPVIRTGRGRYSLAPAEIERRTAANPNRTPPFSGGGCTKSIAAQGVYPPPLETPDGGIGGFENPPLNPRGVSKGGDQTPGSDWDLPQSPPDGGRGGGVSETRKDQPYESPERLAATREERLPQATREERDADQLWLQQRGLTSAAPQPATRAPGSAPPPWLPVVLELRQAVPDALIVELVNSPDMERWRANGLTARMVDRALKAHDKTQREAGL